MLDVSALMIITFFVFVTYGSLVACDHCVRCLERALGSQAAHEQRQGNRASAEQRGLVTCH